VTTAAQLIKASLQEILVQASESPLEADEYQDAIFALNNMMASYDAISIDLGYTIVENLGDDITVAPGAIQPIIKNLALELAPQFDAMVTPDLARQAMTGMRTLRRITRKFPVTRFPATLPIGSGNYISTYRSSAFYTDLEPEILGEVSGSIELEENHDAP
jgi:hypothetical protein